MWWGDTAMHIVSLMAVPAVVIMARQTRWSMRHMLVSGLFRYERTSPAARVGPEFLEDRLPASG
jgi:hypothetical protein